MKRFKKPQTKSVAGKKKNQQFLQRHHAMLTLIIVLGWVVPPLAVLIRFGIGIDFFLNIIFTCMGYFPGHFHNFFLQNIRNNYGRGRTPKWALKAGLVQDDTEYVKSTRQWGGRYGERNIRNAYDDPDRPFEDEHGNEIPHNAVERFVENHGIHPAQPGAGFGERGNDTFPRDDDDLLEGLPDEDRDRRRREKKNRKKEYGAGLEAYDQDNQDREAGTGIYAPSNARNDSLIGDLEDPDRMRSSTSARRAGNQSSSSGYGRGDGRDRAPSLNSYDSSEGAAAASSRRGLFGGKKSGRSKKSERYGLAADHKDFSSPASAAYYGNSSSNSGRDREREREREPSYSSGNNNPYGTLSTRREYSGGDRSSSSKYTSSNNPYGGGRDDRYASRRSRYDEPQDDYDRYDIRTSGDQRNKSRRNNNNDDEEDFMNHQF